VVGDFDSDKIRLEVGELFGGLPAGQQPARPRLLRPFEEQPGVRFLEAPVHQAHLMIGFPTPGAREGAAPALDLLAFVLGRGEDSRLAKRVKTEAGLVTSASASTYSFREMGLFLIEAQLDAAKTTEALTEIVKEVYRLGQEPASASELSRARANFQRSFVQARETVQGHANQRGRYQSLYGNPDYEEIYLDQIRQLDAERVRSVARALFKTDRLSVVLLVPEGTGQRPGAEEITSLGASLEAPPAPPSIDRGARLLKATLENGFEIVVQENRRLPLAAVQAGLLGGLLLEDEANNGLHNFIAGMLTQGTPRLTSAQIAHEVEQLGGMLNASAGHNMLALSGLFPSQQVKKGLEIFLEVLLHPTFPEKELERKRQEILARIQSRQERVRNRAFQLFYQTLFHDHPYRLHPLGQRERLLEFHREHLITHYQRLITSERMVLAVAGDVDGQEILQKLQSRLSLLERSPPDALQPPTEGQPGENQVERKTLKSKQAHLVLGFVAPAKGHPDYFPMKVLQTILSGIGGRLFVQLRDRQGLAYSVSAFALDDPFQGAFGVHAATDPTTVEKMREGILEEIRRLRDEPVGPGELVRAKNSLIGSYRIARQTNSALAGDLVYNELFGLGDFGQLYRQGIEKVTGADVLKFARDYLSPERYTLAIVGP